MNALQGEDWLIDRSGMITASNFDKVLSKGQGKTRRAYLLKLAAERLTGQVQETYQNDAMARGIELEEQARNEYEFIIGNTVELSGFVRLNDDVGCSPDGLVGDSGLVEIKCPLATTHISYVLAGKLPADYIPQVQGQLWVTGREWCDFFSYCPDIKSRYFLKIRVYPDKAYIEALAAEVAKFADELHAIVKAMS